MTKKKRGKKEFSDLEHKSFWIVIGMIFLLSVMTILSLINSNSLTGHATVQNIAYMKEGSSLFFEIKDVKGMQFADIKLIETVKGGQIVFKEDLVDFDGKVFNSFTVSSRDSLKFGVVTYTLKIKTVDLLPVGINPKDVILYVNGKEVETVKTSTEDKYTYYTAKLKFEVGDYVIGRAKPIEEAAPEDVVEEDTLGVASVIANEEDLGETGDLPLSGQAIQPSKSKEGFFRKIVDFFKNLFR